ncbi:hypothetical protein DSM25559_3424 [Agrobacterium rosae]|uniref:Uncharacterized protein n=1 Tax=Agrobacterium rosae TaxID=1972867 RepID=A0A1R3U428_9HYPH|nr:hypothetical protein DSM25559_3424 [Agrobacterium rosae]
MPGRAEGGKGGKRRTLRSTAYRLHPPSFEGRFAPAALLRQAQDDG